MVQGIRSMLGMASLDLDRATEEANDSSVLCVKMFNEKEQFNITPANLVAANKHFLKNMNFTVIYVILLFTCLFGIIKAEEELVKREDAQPEESKPQECSDKAGQVVVMTPTKNNLALIGFNLNITWKYSPFTNLETYPKSFINIYYQQTNDGDGFKHVGRKKDRQVVECKFKNIEEDMFNMEIGNYFKVLGHHNDDQNWDYISYHNICTLTKWKDIPQLFNTLNKSGGECKFTDFDIFIMKNDISPMWEDVENRNGSICSIKVDSLKDGYRILRELLINVANNTLMEFSPESWDKINGLSFSPKKMDSVGSDSSYCVIIKIWFKQNYGNNSNIDKYLNLNIQDLLKKYSVKVKSIKPEY
jgi:hypothetical protein